MRKVFLSFILFPFVVGCGGGPSTQEVGIEAVPDSSYIQQDVICCQNFDTDANECTSYAIPEPKTFTISIINEQLLEDSEFGEAEPVQVRGCYAEFYPKNGAPEIPDGYEYVVCTPVTIAPGETKDIIVSIESPLVDMMYDYWQQWRTSLSYRVKLTFDIVGYNTGDFDTSVYIDIDFDNFVYAENDMCQTE